MPTIGEGLAGNNVRGLAFLSEARRDTVICTNKQVLSRPSIELKLGKRNVYQTIEILGYKEFCRFFQILMLF